MSDLRRLVLTGGYPDVRSDLEAARAEATGADAVVVLSVRQEQWEKRGAQLVHNVRRFRRLKVMTQAGVDRHARYETIVRGAPRVEDVKARTGNFDGRKVFGTEAEVTTTPLGPGEHRISVVFRDVVVGSYLDVYIATNRDETYFFHVEPWRYQEELPVLQANYLFSPPDGLEWGSAFQGTSTVDPERVTTPNKREYRVFTFLDVPPLPAGAYLPPAAAFAQTLFIRPLAYSDKGDAGSGGRINIGKMSAPTGLGSPDSGSGTALGGALTLDIGVDWEVYAKTNATLARRVFSSSARHFPESVVTSAAAFADPREKAESIRKALAGVDLVGERELIRRPHDVYKFGRGREWFIAHSHALALRGAGLSADVLETHRRGDGPIPQGFPLPALLKEYVIRVNDPEKPFFYAPLYDVPAGILPSDLRGSLAIPLTEGTIKPITLPGLRCEENFVHRKVTGRLEPDGKLVAETSASYSPVAAEALRARLRAADGPARLAVLREDLRRVLPAAEVLEARFENLDDGSAQLLAVYKWEAPGAARVDGNKLHLGAVFYDRWDPAAWPEGERTHDVDFGLPFESEDRVEIQLPPGVKKVFRVEEVRAQLLGVGLFEAIDTTTVKKIALKRHVRLEDALVPAAVYPDVQIWFADLARFDNAATTARIGAEEPEAGDDAAEGAAAGKGDGREAGMPANE